MGRKPGAAYVIGVGMVGLRSLRFGKPSLINDRLNSSSLVAKLIIPSLAMKLESRLCWMRKSTTTKLTKV